MSITVQMAVKVDDSVSAADIVSITDACTLAIKLSVSAIAKVSLTSTKNACPPLTEKGVAENAALLNMIR